jgi:hypothetical protein
MMAVTAKNYQIKRRIFWAWEDDREVAWLSSMSREGWHLAAMRYGFSYHFLKGEPQNYVYQLDYQYNLADESEYVSIFEAGGWEYLGQFFYWRYFRKEALPGEYPEIYTDPCSKIERNRRIRNVFIPLCIANLSIGLANIGIYLNNSRHFNGNLSVAILNFVVGLLLLYGISKINNRNRDLQQIGSKA